MSNSRTVKFVFRDSDKNDIVGFDLIIPVETTWLEMDKLFNEQLAKFSGKDDNCVSSDMNFWMTNKEFPDGKHYFINWDNGWGFISAYLYRVV